MKIKVTAQLKEGRSRGHETRKFSKTIQSAFLKAASAVGNFAKSIGRGLANKAKQAVSSLKGLGKSSNNVSKSILKLSNMFKLMLIRMAMRAAIQGVKEGMQNLVQYSDSANQSMSGCGKTTTLTIIAGFQPRDSGRIFVNNREVTKPADG